MHHKEKLLFVPNSVKSHLIPTFYLSQLLKDRYEIHYFVQDAGLLDLVTTQGFTAHQSKTNHIGFSFELLDKQLRYRGKNVVSSFLGSLSILWKDPFYDRRKKEIDELMGQLAPKAIFLDVFGATNFIFFHKYLPKLKVLFFSPMLSTHSRKGIPDLDQSSWNSWHKKDSVHKGGFSGLVDYWCLKLCCRRIGMEKKYKLRSVNRFTHYTFDGITELVMAPIELELSAEASRHKQQYLGLCIASRKNEPKGGGLLDINLNKFKQLAKKGRKIVFCSFGAYFRSFEHHQSIATFITNLTEAATLADVELIVACNKVLLDVINNTVGKKENVHLYAYVPQLDVLEISDVFITHGGLGSVKEAIYAKVPMIVYPLEPKFDNVGNAFKVAHHELGLMGELRSEDAGQISVKILEVLRNQKYHERVANFSNEIASKYTSAYVLSIIDKQIN